MDLVSIDCRLAYSGGYTRNIIEKLKEKKERVVCLASTTIQQIRESEKSPSIVSMYTQSVYDFELCCLPCNAIQCLYESKATQSLFH